MRKLNDDELKVANIKPFGLRLQPGLKDWIETAARLSNRSINAEIVDRLERSFLADYNPQVSLIASHEQSQLMRLSETVKSLEQRIAKLEQKR